MYEKWNCISCVTGDFHISRNSILQSFNACEAAYVHTRTPKHTRESGARGLFFPPNLFPFRDSRSRYMVLESFQGADSVIFRAKSEAKSVCKVPPDFSRFLVRFWASCYYLDNIDLTRSSRCYLSNFSRIVQDFKKCKEIQNVCYHTDSKYFNNFK